MPSHKIAIISMVGRFPQASKVEEFWNNLLFLKDTIRETPSARWSAEDFLASLPIRSGKMYCNLGGYIDDVDKFDADFFNISPREAQDMDPQQRILLELTWELFERCGIPQTVFSGSNTGVYIGNYNSDYARLLLQNYDYINSFTGTGTSGSICANRISYRFNLRGPSISIDTACSSSLTAIHLAVQALRLYQADLAIAGGVNIILTPTGHISASQSQMLSPDGHCKVFDDTANGYVRGEGCGLVLLKRLEDAIADGNEILAIISGSAINQDGLTNGLTAPNGLAQQAVIRNALQDAECTPEQIDYVEIHGTGTSLGDPIEVRAIQNAYAKARKNKSNLILGSVKSHIGHLEAAAGIAGLIKTVFSLQHGKIPGNLQFSNLNSHINVDKLPLTIPKETIDWPASQKRYAAVSSFGFGGSNAHVILEAGPSYCPTPISIGGKSLHFVISAKTIDALNAYITLYKTYLSTTKDELSTICYTQQYRRTRLPYRIVLAVNTITQLQQLLENQEYNIDKTQHVTVWPDDFSLSEMFQYGHFYVADLPTYPWQRQRYWADIISQKQTTESILHPFLGVHLPEIANQHAIIYEKDFNLQEDSISYLQEHKIYDDIVYPGAGYIELFLQAFHNKNGDGIELKEISIDKPLVLGTGTTKIQIVINDNEAAIYSKEHNSWHLHSKCIKEENKALYISTDSLSNLECRINKEVDVASFYNELKAIGLYYGPHFQVIKKAKLDGNEALVYLQAPFLDSGYLAYPALLDGALQGLALLQRGKNLYLPVGCKSIQWQQPFSSNLVAHIQLLEITNDFITANITIYANEQCIMRLNEFKAKRVNQISIKNLFNKKTANWYYEQIWEAYIPRKDSPTKDMVIYDAREIKEKSPLESAIMLVTFLQKLITEARSLSAIYIITQNAYGESINVNQASLNGLIKTAILEHPKLAICQVDMTEDENIEPLLEILSHDSGKTQILRYYQDHWYSAKIVNQIGLRIPASDYRLIKNESGTLDELVIIEEDTLPIKDDEIIIIPKAVGLNFRDVLNVMNLYPGDAGALGSDVAGVVKSVGKAVKHYQIGDEIVGLAVGSLASQAITHESLIVPKPNFLSFCEAATIPTVFMTAYLALVKLAQLKEGEWILIHAGTGGVGLAAIQLATYLKANIICTVGSERKKSYLHTLGIKHIFNSRNLSFKEDILRATNNQGVDVVLNSLSGQGFIGATLQSCAKNARFIEIGKRDIWSYEQVGHLRADVNYIILALDQICQDNPQEISPLLQTLIDLFKENILVPLPKTCFTLSKAVDAFKYLQQAKQIGKVVINLPSTHLVLNDKASYLITGGLGGIGLEIAKFLGQHGAKHLVLMARHQPSDHAVEVINLLKSKAIEITVVQKDVSLKEDVESTLATYCTHYPLKGIFHAAGTLADAPLIKQNAASYKNVFAAKVQGAWYLHEATKDIDLDYFVLFSSFASLNGSPTQSNYAAANSFLDGLAHYRQQLGLKAQSINWGPWKETGMAKNLVANYERQGIQPLTNQEALDALNEVLKQGIPQLGVIHINWQTLTESLSPPPSWLADFIEKKSNSPMIDSLKIAPPEQREKLLKQIVIQEVKKILNQTQNLDESKGFFEMGMDSLLALELKNKLQNLVGEKLSDTVVFDYPTLDTLIPYLASLLKIKTSPLPSFSSTSPINSEESIAVIGMGCRFPGGANDPETFWKLLEQGFDSSIEVPENRWNIDDYYDPTNAPGKMISRKSSFLTTPIENFDAAFFGISPREAEYLDPQQRLLLEITWEALENANIAPPILRNTATGVFIGISSNDYGMLLSKNVNDEEIEAYYGTGNAASVAAGRISYTLGLLGPSLAIDTACSSSLVAIHEACQSLRQQESHLAIVGGVNLLLTPEPSINFSRAHMLAADGHCKTFDATADGYVRGEGCGIIILKRLSDALTDQDNILAVIKGSAINQDGASSGLTVPNGPSQERVITAALEQAQLAPNDIDYIEAHGTGTRLGDPIEINAIKNVFHDKKKNPLIIGTVKTNIGHLEAAAGIAGVIKTILSLQYKCIPKHLHFNTLNPSIELASIPAQIPVDVIEWKKRSDKLRRAGISSFGFSGTNAHLILEEAPLKSIQEIPAKQEQQVLMISAKTELALATQVQQYIAYLKQTHEPIANICYTSQLGRAQFLHHIAVIGQSIAELITKLNQHEYASEQEIEQYLYPTNSHYLKVQLPTYAFEHRKYWITLKEKISWLANNNSHPLLQHHILLPDSDEMYFESVINAGNPKFIADHLIYDYTVMAGAAYLSMALSLAKDYLGARYCKLLQVEFVDALVLSQHDKPIHFVVKVSPTEKKQRKHIQIYSRHDELDSTSLHVKMQIELADSLPLPKRLETIKPSFSEQTPYTSEKHLQETQRLSLMLGPHFHWLEKVFVQDNQVLAQLRTAVEPDESRHYVLYPGLIDSAFQSFLALMPGKMDTLAIPFTIETFAFDLKAKIPRWVYGVTQQEDHQLHRRSDIYFFDEFGGQVGYITGFISQVAPKAALERSLKRQIKAVEYFYNTQWVELTLNTQVQKTTGEALLYDARPISKQTTSSEPLLHLLHYLENILQTQPTLNALTIVTEQAYAVNNETVNPYQALFNGFIKTAILENPELCIRQLDVEKDYKIENELVEQLPPKEQIIVVRDNILYAPRLMPLALTLANQGKLNIPSATRWQLEQKHRGDLKSLILVPNLSNSLLQPHEVEIAIRAVGLNFRDVLVALDLYPGESGGLGGDCAGVITRIGAEVKDFKVGDKVFGIALGAFKSYAITTSKLVTLLPNFLSFAEGASLPVIMLTAYYALYQLAHIKAKDKVLIHTGAGGVGLMAIQLAKLAGATIYTTASKSKQAYLKSLGVNYIYDSRNTDYQQYLLKDTNGTGVDIILNTLTSEGFKEASLACLKPEGIFLEISKRNIYSYEELAQIRKDVQYHIIAIDEMFVNEPDEVKQLLTTTASLLIAKQLKPPLLTTYPIASLLEAMKNMQQGKHIGKLVITFPESILTFNDKASYLITGGLGGIGLELAQYLQQHGAKRIILSSRGTPNDLAQQVIEKLQINGVDVVIHQADISNKKAVEQLLNISHHKVYPLKGIFHVAGVIDDAPLLKLTTHHLENVLAAKVSGTWHLHTITVQKKYPLDYFVLFSSIASLNGSPAQSNYAAANSFLDSLAKLRQQQGLPAQIINWGPWKEIGMAKDLVIRHERQGIKPLSNDEAFNALTYVLMQGLTGIGIVHANWKKLIESLPLPPSWLNHFVQDNTDTRLIDILQTVLPEQRETLLKEIIIQEIKKVLGQTEPLDESKGFFEMGMDSLLALELKNKLQSLTGTSLPNTLVFDYPTLDALVPYINSIVKVQTPSEYDSSPPSAKLLEPNITVTDDINNRIIGIKSIIFTDKQVQSEFLCVGEGEPLLLIGGLGASALIWEKQVSQLTEKYRVIIYYPPGHGKTSFYEPKTLTSIVTHLYDGLKMLNLSFPLSVVGWSLGGIIARELSTTYPEIIKSLVIISSPSTISLDTSLKNMGDEFVKINNFERNTLAFYNGSIIKYYSTLFKNGGVNVDNLITCRCLVLYGQEDKYITPAESLALKQVMPNAIFTEIKDAGHYLMLTHADIFNEELNKFI